jgi:hypothetical protein
MLVAWSPIRSRFGEQGAEGLIAETVDLVVAVEDGFGQLDVAVDDRIDAVAHHPFSQFSHAGNVDVGLDPRVLHQPQGGLGDVHRLIADSLQVSVDAADRQHEAQVGGHQLVQGQ